MTLLAFLLTYWRLFAGAAAIAAFGVFLGYEHHTIYEEGVAAERTHTVAAESALAAERKAHETDINTWKAASAAIKVEEEKESKRRDQVLNKTKADYEKRIKSLEEAQKQRGITLSKIVPANSIVVVPSGFTSLYNSAVNDFGTASASQSEAKATSGPQVAGTPERLDGTTTASVVLECVNKYNNLAAQTNALIDIVQGVETGENTSPHTQ